MAFPKLILEHFCRGCSNRLVQGVSHASQGLHELTPDWQPTQSHTAERRAKD